MNINTNFKNIINKFIEKNKDDNFYNAVIGEIDNICPAYISIDNPKFIEVDEIYYSGLYQTEVIQKQYAILKKALTEKRMHHTAGVVETALLLAAQNHVDGKKAFTAALLHDCAKYLPDSELFRRSTDPTPILPVLHSEIGAQLANELYGVEDPEILRAIRLHTTGDAGMTKLDKVVYLADMIEPSRDYPGVQALRDEPDLDRAVQMALQRSLAHIRERGFDVHPATLRAIQDLGGTI